MAEETAPRGSAFELGTDGARVVVVGFDGSPTSLRAGAYAAGLARREGARLVAVHVMTPPVLALLVPDQPWPLEEAMADRTAHLRGEVEAGAAHAGVPAEFVAVRGEPFAELTRIATELRADVVVVGASARTAHRLAGSVGSRLVRTGRWPVVIVP
ncbi:universal stress protein [Geodermatophilus sp. SYSU D01105]